MSKGGELRPIAYASTPLTDAEKKFGISALEGHALCFAVRKWRHLLYGNTTICITDNSALKSLTSPTKTFENPRMARMALTLSEHDLVIAHRPGTSKELIISDMLSRCGMENDAAKLESLMEQAWGCMGQICRETKLELSKQVMSSRAQQRRLQHIVDGAAITEMIYNKEITTLKQMVDAIAAGEREVEQPAQQGDDTTSRFVEMYDMINAVEDELCDKGHVSDENVLAAQILDPYCRQMKQILSKGSKCRTSTDQMYRDCKWQAPYHTVTEDGLLRRLLWKKGSKADAQVIEGRAPAVVPEAATSLQRRLCEVLHAESGHAAYTKTYSNILDRYIWPGMTTQIADVVRTCNQCSFHGDKLPKAPIQGHVTAAEPSQRIMMDVVHMDEVEGYKYLVTLVDVFSRWAMAVPVENIKAATITRALRRQAIPNGMGRPFEFLIDGGSEFKKELQAACSAWGSKWRPHTPHHSESAGAVERFNKTIELRIAHFTKHCSCNWLDAMPLALEAYNGSIHVGLSKGGIAFSPAELWLGRKLRFNSDVRPQIHDRPTDVQKYGEWIRQQTQLVKDWIHTADAEYRKTMEKSGNHQAQRKLEVGDIAQLHKPPEKRSKNSGEETWDGPYEVVGTGEQPTDYLVQRQGSKRAASWQHIDNLKKKHNGVEPEALGAEDVVEAATAKSKLYQVEAIVGERGRSRSSKHYLIKYQGYDDAWWQPAKNLNECGKVLKAWEMLTAAQQKEETAKASVANPDDYDVNLIMDLRLSKQQAARQLVKDICSKLGIDRSRLAGVVASPMCNTYTQLDSVNVERGHNFRLPKAPYPPRPSDGTLESIIKGQIAQEHDDMVENLLHSILQDKAEGYEYSFCIENPRGMLRHRPYMIEDEWLNNSNRATTDYCVHDHDYMKPTDLWHSFGGAWQPKGITGDGKCHQKCGKGCRKLNGRFSHYKRHAGASGSGVTGPDQMLQKWEIPHNLCAEVVD